MKDPNEYVQDLMKVGMTRQQAEVFVEMVLVAVTGKKPDFENKQEEE